VSAFRLRLFRDPLAPGSSHTLAVAHRVLYVQAGELTVLDGATPSTVETDRAWHGAGSCTLRAGAAGATVLRWELLPISAAGDGEPVLEHSMELAAGAAWLLRCDRVDFDPGGVAWPHRHRGGGIRCLIAGELDVTVGGAPPRPMRSGDAWFESGSEPVLARASATEPTSFIRVAVLPAEIRGQTSILYVDPADAARGRPRRYTVFVDRPIALA
jgi:quercetin dioxygenase-like cupin family protein